MTQHLARLTNDTNPTVRIAAALALAKLGETTASVPLLAESVDSDNLITGLYAISALEQVGPLAKGALPVIRVARDSPYEFTRRIARRIVHKWSD